MSYDSMFRLIFALLMIALYAVRLVYRGRIPEVQKSAFARSELSVVIATRLWALSLVVYLLPLRQFIIPSSHYFFRWTGVVMMALCLPLSLWIYHALGSYFFTAIKLAENHSLVQIGPYRLVRHPMYATLLLCIAGSCLISNHILVVSTGMILAIVMLKRIKKEEAMLHERFGEAYLNYKRTSGAIIPRLRLFH